MAKVFFNPSKIYHFPLFKNWVLWETSVAVYETWWRFVKCHWRIFSDRALGWRTRCTLGSLGWWDLYRNFPFSFSCCTFEGSQLCQNDSTDIHSPQVWHVSSREPFFGFLKRSALFLHLLERWHCSPTRRKDTSRQPVWAWRDCQISILFLPWMGSGTLLEVIWRIQLLGRKNSPWACGISGIANLSLVISLFESVRRHWAKLGRFYLKPNSHCYCWPHAVKWIGGAGLFGWSQGRGGWHLFGTCRRSHGIWCNYRFRKTENCFLGICGWFCYPWGQIWGWIWHFHFVWIRSASWVRTSPWNQRCISWRGRRF